MKGEGKVQVVVKSRRVPARTTVISLRQISYSGVWMAPQKDHVVLYEEALDQEHLRAIDDGKKLARELGLPFEVLDESKSSLFRRMLSSLSRGSSKSPRLVIHPSYTPMISSTSSCETTVPV